MAVFELVANGLLKEWIYFWKIVCFFYAVLTLWIKLIS